MAAIPRGVKMELSASRHDPSFAAIAGALLVLALSAWLAWRTADSWMWYLAGTACLVLALGIREHTDLVLAAGLMAIPLTRFSTWTERVETAQMLLFAIIGCAWLYRHRNRLDAIRRRTPFHGLFLIWACLLAVNAFVSSDPLLTLRVGFGHAAAFLLFFVFWAAADDPGTLRRLVHAFLLAGAAVAILAVIQYGIMNFRLLVGWERFFLVSTQQYLSVVRHLPEHFIPGEFRSLGTFHHPNLLGVYLALVYPLCAALAVSVRQGSLRWAYAGGALAALAGLFCTGSRGAWLSVAIASLVLLAGLWSTLGRDRLLGPLAVLMAVGGLVGVRSLDFLRLAQGLSSRDIIWTWALEAIRSNPLWGCGLGVYHLEVVSRLGFPTPFDFDLIISKLLLTGQESELMSLNAHNVYLNYAVEMGLLAPLIIFGLYAAYAVTVWPRLRPGSGLDDWRRAVLLGCTAALAGNFVHGFFEAITNFSNFNLSLAFVFVLGAGVGLGAGRETSNPGPP
jgi:O-antigen ligase